MNAILPPVYRDCWRLLVHTEELVRRFSRYHKYTVGTDLRRQAMAVMRGVHTAVYDRTDQAKHIGALVWRIDEYKLTLQLAMEVGAFVHGHAGQQKPASPGFAAFETAATLAAGIGKQCGGWHKKASGLHAQVASRATGQAGAGSQPVASPQASPASLSAHAAFESNAKPGLATGLEAIP